MSILLFRIAAALCFLAVALGAFGAHGLRSTLEGRGMVDVWNKAVFYQFIHAIALLVLAFYGTVNRGACWLLLMGILLFSGSLYLLALNKSPLAGSGYSLGRSLFPWRLGVAGSRTAKIELSVKRRAAVVSVRLGQPWRKPVRLLKRDARILFCQPSSGILSP